MEKKKVNKEEIYTSSEVQSIIQSIYSEFVELPIGYHTPLNLRKTIQEQVEEHPLKPIKIFN